MNRRKSLLLCAMIILALCALLFFPARMLLENRDKAFEEKQGMIMQMIEERKAIEELPAPSAVLPIMDIEDIWALEDEREEAQDELVSAMFNNGAALGYDRADQTFYCSLDVGLEEWPQIELSARGVQGVNVAWLDDYTYDWCSDAVSEGYRYELFVWNETQYAYIGVVFTGLPVVTLRVQEEIGETYVAGHWTVASGNYDAVDEAALVHLRGGGFEQQYPKNSYRIEMHGLSAQGTEEKRRLSVLGMEADSDWLLVANTSDETRVRNHLAWDLWKKWNQDGHAFALLDSKLVEVFVNDEYMGVYQLMQRVDVPEEIERMGGNLNTDIGMRIIAQMNIETRPVANYRNDCGYFIELRYKPEHMSVERAFKEFDIYHRLNCTRGKDFGVNDDDEFAQFVRCHIDTAEIMEYFLFQQIASFGYDNVYNNVYMWAMRQDGEYKFYLSPWDMDRVFAPVYTDGSDLPNMWFELAVRMLDLNVDNCREILWGLLEEKKETLLTDDGIYQWFMETEDMLNASGAYRRDILKWTGEERELNLAEQSAYTISHRKTVEFYMNEMWPLEGYQAGY